MFPSEIFNVFLSLFLNFHLPGTGLIVLGYAREGLAYAVLSFLLGVVAVFPTSSHFDQFCAIAGFDVLLFLSSAMVLKRCA